MIEIETQIQVLKLQRNEAMDAVAILNGQVAALKAQIEELTKEEKD